MKTNSNHSSFLTPLVVSPLADGIHWRLIEPFVYEAGGEKIEVPKGFVTDFASIPRVFQNILPPCGQWGKSAVLHDWLYTTGVRSREVADGIFAEGMRALNVTPWKRWTIYLAVRLFGWAAWNNHRRNRHNRIGNEPATPRV